jgi:hypothetical protein
MTRLWVQGVVKNGQVVLASPLDLPDGTVVTVTDYDPDDDPRPRQPTVQLTEEVLRELVAVWRKEKDWTAAEARIRELQNDRR